MAEDNKKVKILINTPNWKKPYLGGVANHYYGLRAHWTNKIFYNIVGNRGKHPGAGKYLLPFDIIKFIVKIVVLHPRFVVLNPSLAVNALKRDTLLLRIAKMLNKQVIVCFHGFDPKYSLNINKSEFVDVFNKADKFMVLSSKIKETLVNWGISKPIILYTTKIQDSLIDKFNVENRSIGEIKCVTYLARVTQQKGIFIALDIFNALSKKYPTLEFRVVGDGADLNSAKEFIKKHKLNVEFTGNITGDNLINEFKRADLYIFTSYHEGMPTSVLEAMAFGLPIITRPVGGLIDFFTNDMGRMVDSYDAKDFIPAIEEYLTNPDLAKQTSVFNHNYAKENFLASKVAKQIESIIER